jgi:hypothetical protein
MYVRIQERSKIKITWSMPPECTCAVSPIWNPIFDTGMLTLINSLLRLRTNKPVEDIHRKKEKY